MRFIDFDPAAFLRDHWQKTPCLIKNPWGTWTNPLAPDELAGLACEAGVEARLIECKPRDQPEGWSVEQGPIADKRFAKLGKHPWTLLVNAVDHHVPDVAALIAPFRFIPNWRIDDVMVSYATDGGGVGPHFDQYDVFLIQGLGRRRWRLGGPCNASSPLLPHDDLRLLAGFEPVADYVLEPGDILYVPPGVAHDGVALADDCMTYSVGFRAPARSELIAHFCDDVLARLGEDDRYADPALALQANPGEISGDALARLHAMILDEMQDRTTFARWFGAYVSAPKYPEMDWAPDKPISVKALRKQLAKHGWLTRNPASRFAFARGAEGGVTLFVDGETYDCAGELAVFAEALCGAETLEMRPDWIGSDAVTALVVAMVNQGCVGFGDR